MATSVAVSTTTRAVLESTLKSKAAAANAQVLLEVCEQAYGTNSGQASLLEDWQLALTATELWQRSVAAMNRDLAAPEVRSALAAKYGVQGATLLDVKVGGASVEEMELCLRYDADLDEWEDDGNTALVMAAVSEQIGKRLEVKELRRGSVEVVFSCLKLASAALPLVNQTAPVVSGEALKHRALTALLSPAALVPMLCIGAGLAGAWAVSKFVAPGDPDTCAVLGGMSTSAGVGAAIGSTVAPGVGTAAGGAVGAVLGGLAGAAGRLLGHMRSKAPSA